jgi:hypothetical protein
VLRRRHFDYLGRIDAPREVFQALAVEVLVNM